MRKKGAVAAVILCVAVLAAFIIGDFLFSRSFSDSFTAMNTVIGIQVTGIDSQSALDSLRKEINRLDTQLLSRTAVTSEIYAVNKGTTRVSAELDGLLTQLKQIEKSTSAFCIALGALSDLWSVTSENPVVPSAEEIADALSASSDWKINNGVVELTPGTLLDLGSVGKGIGCDYAREILDQTHCSQAIVSVGGSVLLWSGKSDDEFTVGIRNPYGAANEYVATLRLNPCCVSTSGSYERYFQTDDGTVYHHIFDTATGYPAESELVSVTVISENGLVSDALSTVCFVLGAEKSLPLLEQYSSDAVFITKDKKIITTFGADEGKILSITNNEYTSGDLK